MEAPSYNPPAANSPAPAAPDGTTLSPEYLNQLKEANLRAKKIRRAAVVATIDAWIASFFAAVTLLSIFFGWIALPLGLGLAFSAFNSFRGARMLRAMDIRAPRLLALNQLFLAGLLIAYASYCIWDASRGNSEFTKQIAAEPGLANTLGSIDQLYWYVTLAVYGGLIIGTIIAQGLAALYYAGRRKHLDAYIHSTPAWVIEFQRTQTA